jgi:hypothetical protein
MAGRFKLLIVAVGCLAFALVFYYRWHLWWKMSAAWGSIETVPAIPSSPMGEAGIPQEWLVCCFGVIQFALPPELAHGAEVQKPGFPGLSFRDGLRSVLVMHPWPIEMSTSDYLAKEFHMPEQGRGLSLTRLRYACYRASSDDFRWSMSAKEVQWLAWLMNMRRVLWVTRDRRAEFLFREDLEGLLGFHGTSLSFDWQTPNDVLGASIIFTDSRGEEACLAWARSVCQSLKVRGDVPFPRMGEPIPFAAVGPSRDDKR